MCDFLIDRGKLLCVPCLDKVQPLASIKIGPPDSELEVFSRFSYSDLMKKLVMSKYSQDLSTLTKAGRLLHTSSGLLKTMENSGIKSWVVVPVPLHWTRQLKRGFNQAQTLCQGLSKELSAPAVNALYRKVKTKFQSETATKTERASNVAGVFGVNTMPIIGRTKKILSRQVAGKGVILVDDLLTTGSTLLECAKVLRRELKPGKIIAVTLCRS